MASFDLRALFVDELGWDHGGGTTEVNISGSTFCLNAIAHKRGMVAYQYVADRDAAFPDHPTRQKIEKVVTKTVREHIIVYATHDGAAQYWQWVKREPGQPDRSRQHIYHREQPGEALIQKLERLAFRLDEEADLTIVDVSGRVRAAFDVERVTKRFYDRFRKEHDAFLGFIAGIEVLADREWYASLMLNRMMFIYFIQKRGFLDGDVDYLRNRLGRMQVEHGKDRFQSFYRLFLLRLFHEGLSQPAADRDPDLAQLLGTVPYLNGGLFEVHDLERDRQAIHIPDVAFQRIFDFFDAYHWHLDDRPLHDGTEINPDVLGYIFEKYINQKQMGAYYTKEDITGYISRNTVIPFLFDEAQKECPIAFGPRGGVWRLLSDNPDRYFFDSVRHGITHDVQKRCDLDRRRELPPQIAAGLADVSKRGEWNSVAPADYGLPTETWREHIARRQRYDDVHAKLANGEVVSINDLVTYNLDIETFAQDVIAASEGPELVRGFWSAISRISILDPTCGSGAFLFAALNILEPIYVTCLESMQGFLDDLARTGRKHHPDTMRDFREVLGGVADHANESYFILKSIIVHNLYGVDLMKEAAEICKLRLFLRLVAQLESYEQIEPLPDIDFNIRAGNTVVGFASLDHVKRALAGDMLQQLALPNLTKRAEEAD
ncbi:MAG: SAM-dependent methyltransferase, partial [Chloroflexi bacterium]|nr:SAM-dependent methyltransferase [Chloroflexota bacterium]